MLQLYLVVRMQVIIPLEVVLPLKMRNAKAEQTELNKQVHLMLNIKYNTYS